MAMAITFQVSSGFSALLVSRLLSRVVCQPNQLYRYNRLSCLVLEAPKRLLLRRKSRSRAAERRSLAGAEPAARSPRYQKVPIPSRAANQSLEKKRKIHRPVGEDFSVAGLVEVQRQLVRKNHEATAPRTRVTRSPMRMETATAVSRAMTRMTRNLIPTVVIPRVIPEAPTVRVEVPACRQERRTRIWNRRGHAPFLPARDLPINLQNHHPCSRRRQFHRNRRPWYRQNHP